MQSCPRAFEDILVIADLQVSEAGWVVRQLFRLPLRRSASHDAALGADQVFRAPPYVPQEYSRADAGVRFELLALLRLADVVDGLPKSEKPGACTCVP